MAEIICNTSPLQYLHQLGLLELLPTLLQRVIVPRAVVEELAAGRRLGLVLPDLSTVTWIEVRKPASSALSLAWDLGAGETEVLALALESPGARVILDDALARRAADLLKIPKLGTLGLLLRAKQSGHLAAIAPVLDRLEALGFRLAPPTRLTVLKLAGE